MLPLIFDAFRFVLSRSLIAFSWFLSFAFPCHAQDGAIHAAVPTYTAEQLVYMEVKARGQINLVGKVLVVGTVQLEEEGFRFTPITKVPDGFMSQKDFEYEFWYNSMFKDLYVSYASIKKMNYNSKIKLKDKRKYRIYSRHDSYWQPIHNQIVSRITKSDN